MMMMMIVMMMIVQTFLFFATTSQAFNLFQAQPALIVNPPSESIGKRQAILIYFPGNGVPASAYQELVQNIQRQTTAFALTGVILTYPQIIGLDVPPFFGGEKLVDDAITSAGIQGPFDLFLAGHSLGGILVQELLKNERIPYPTKIVLHASYLVDARIRRAFLSRTLTLLGDRDGVNRLTIVPTVYTGAGELTKNVQVLREINHRSFSNGSSNANVDRLDLSCTTSREVGTRVIARATAVFLDDRQDDPDSDSAAAHDDDVGYLLPFAQALAEDKNGQTCTRAQERLVSSQEHDYRITSQNYFRQELPAFLFATPSWTSDERLEMDDIQIKSFYNEPVFNSVVLRISSFPQAIDILRCKLVKKTNEIEPPSCQAMNRMIFEHALSTVPASVQARYRESRRQLTFGPDVIEPMVMKWALGKVQWQDNVVTSPAHRSNKSDKVYCTLISSSHAMEYIMIDSQQEA